MSKSERDTAIYEVGRHVTETRSSLERIKNATRDAELRKAWEDFLHSYHRSIGRMISFALKAETSKPWGYRLKAASSGNDEGLVFLREARAAAEHGLEPFALFMDNKLEVGGGFLSAVGIGSQMNITFSGNYLDGKPIGDFSINATPKASDLKLIGKPNVQVRMTPASIQLVPVRSTEKKKTFPVPRTLSGVSVEGLTALQFAEVSFDYLRHLQVEFGETYPSR